MKKIFVILPLLSLVLLGAGCGGSSQQVNTNDGGMYQSSDGGKTWKQTNVYPTATGAKNLNALDTSVVVADPQDPNVFYMGTKQNGLFATTDGGATWFQPARIAELKEGVISDIAVDPKQVCTVYVAKGTAMMKTTTCFRSVETKQFNETRPTVLVSQVAVDAYNPNIVYLGLSNGEIKKSLDGGVSWFTALEAKKPITDILISTVDTRKLVVGTAGEGMYISSDAGANWTQIKKELKEFRGADTVLSLTQTGKDNLGVIIASTGSGLIRSKDYGATWEQIELLTKESEIKTIKTVGVDPQNANRIYYGTDRTFYVTTEGGTKWTTYKIPSTRNPQTILLDPKNPQHLYVGVASKTDK